MEVTRIRDYIIYNMMKEVRYYMILKYEVINVVVTNICDYGKIQVNVIDKTLLLLFL